MSRMGLIVVTIGLGLAALGLHGWRVQTVYGKSTSPFRTQSSPAAQPRKRALLVALSDYCRDKTERECQPFRKYWWNLASGADVIGGIGDFATSLGRVAAGDKRVVTAGSPEELWWLLAPRLAPDAVILLKASRGVQLERLVPHLTTWAKQ